MTVANDNSGLLRTFHIGNQYSCAGGKLGLTLQGSDSIPAVAAILTGTAPFPLAESEIATVGFQASSGATIPIGDAAGTVSFSSRASSGFAMRIYPNAAAAAKAAGQGAGITGRPGERFLSLDLDYDAGASAKGSVALTPGVTATLGAAASRKRDWKVIHRFGDIPAAQAVAETFAAWILPRHIESAESLPPGSWMVADVEGSLSLNLGVQTGFDFTWLRECPAGKLIGDLGLKVSSASAVVSASVGGTCRLVIGRESAAPVLRMSVYKANTATRQINASVATPSITRPKPGDLLAAILGLHPAQVVEDLRPLLSECSRFFDLWDKLGAHSGTTLLALAAEHEPGEMRRLSMILDEIAAVATNPLKVTKILERETADPAFYSTPLGKLLSSAFQGFAMSMQDLNAVRRIAIFAGAARDLLNGKVPQQLAANLNNLPPFHLLDDWMKKKLAEFVGKPPAAYTEADHRAVANLSATLLEKSQTFAAAGVRAARRQLEANFVSTCQAASCDTALLDVEFDFAANPGIAALFQQAVRGDFTRVLAEPVPGIRLRNGVLSHGVERQVHTQLVMPFRTSQSSSVLSSLAKLTAADADGRVLVYELNSSDEWTTQARAGVSRDSKLCVAAVFTDRMPDVRKFGPARGSVGYSFTAGVRALTSAGLDHYLEPLNEQYFPTASRASEIPDGLIGDSRIALDVDVPAETLAEWFEAPLDPQDPVYFKFSRLMQTRLKALVRDVYFSDPARYSTLNVAGPMLVWTCIPAMNSFDGRDLCWDASDADNFERVVRDVSTRESLRQACLTVGPLLSAIPSLRKTAQFYDVASPRIAPITLSNLLASALRKPSMTFGRPVILSALVSFEQDVIRAAVRAALEAARFSRDASRRPSEAIQHLSAFGEDIVKTFHERLRKNAALPADMVGPLGAALFTEASRALGVARTGDDSGLKPRAMFSLTVLKPDARLSAEQLRKGDFPQQLVAAERRIAS